MGMEKLSRSDRWGFGFLFATVCLAMLAWAFPNMSRLVTIPGAISAFCLMLYFFWPEIQTIFNDRRHHVIVSGIVILCLVLAGWYFWPLSLSSTPKGPPQDLSKYEGVLKPGDESTPPMPPNCHIPEDALKVFYGSNVSATRVFPFTILQMGAEEMIVVDKNKDGDLVVTTLKVFDERGEILATIDEGDFWVRNDLRKKRPSGSTLVVYDRHDAEVARIQLLNARSLSVEGVFWLPRQGNMPGIGPVTISKDALISGNNRISGNCNAGQYPVAISIHRPLPH